MSENKYIIAELEDLTCLYEITKELASSKDLNDCLEKSMEVLSSIKKMENGTVTIVNPHTGKLEIEVAYGITAEGRKRGKYKIGEGITGRVVASGEPIIVPHIADEPLFLNKTRSRGDINTQNRSFICVPLKEGKNIIGALSIDKIYHEGLTDQANSDLRFLTILSGLLAQTAKRIQTVNHEKEELRFENLKLKRELSRKNQINDIVGNSSRMQEVYEMIHRVVDSNATVLLRGESGTGKTLVAKALHYNGKRKEKPFVVVNCSALPETLLESELFGHEKGAFTGATERKIGRFEHAEGGTLFLDEIGEISHSVQVKLLHVVQERTFQRLGSTKSISCDVRLVAATNRDLEKAVSEKSFREDLYYRLNVIPVHIPPLRERRDDIPELAEFLLKQAAEELQMNVPILLDDALELLKRYDWYGNVRELKNVMRRLAILTPGASITLSDVALAIGHAEPEEGMETLGDVVRRTIKAYMDQLGYAEATGLHKHLLEQVEPALLVLVMERCHGNQLKASEMLGLNRNTVRKLLKQYKIDPAYFKD
jgi:Nif-specific regulatory protein